MTDPPCIISEAGYIALMHDLDRMRHRVAKREVTLARCDYREIDPAFIKPPNGNSGAAAVVAV